MKKILTSRLFIIVIFFLGNAMYGQTVFKGVLQDVDTQAAIPNAKIGISQQGVGVISDTKGRFAYKKYHQVLGDDAVLTVSALGYETITLEGKAVRSLLNENSTFQLKKANTSDKIVGNKVKVFWDISEGMQGRNLDKELAYLSNHLNGIPNAQVQIEVFNDKLEVVVPWMSWDGDVSRFRESVTAQTFNGPSNYSLLKIGKADQALLFSNGDPNYGVLEVQQGISISGITTVPSELGVEYLNNLASYTSGKFLPLWRMKLAETTKWKTAETQIPTVVTGPIARGSVMSLGKPLQGASIYINGTLDEVSSEWDGSFEIGAKEGDVLKITYLGMFPKEALVEEGKSIDIELIPKNDVLKEVVLTSSFKKVIVGEKELKGSTVPGAPGGITGLGDFFITSEDITPNARTLEQVIRAKFVGVTVSLDPYNGLVLKIKGAYPQWVVDGNLLLPGEPPPFYISDKDIESIVIKDSRMGTRRYGPYLNGLVVVVTTKNVALAKKKYIGSALVKGNDYTEEVPLLNESITSGIIRGSVSAPSGTIQGASISVKGTLDEVYSKADGSFELQAKEGDILQVRYLGMFGKDMLVENTQKIDVKLLPSSDLLNEVVITGETAKSDVINGTGPILDRGQFILEGRRFDVTTLTKDDYKFEHWSLGVLKGLEGKLSGITIEGGQLRFRGSEPLYYIDGRPVDVFEMGSLNTGLIETISIKKNRYGSMGPALLVQTTIYRENNTKIPSPLVTGNEYTEELQNISTPVVTAQQTIQGTVVGGKGPLKDVAITLKGSFNEVYTNAQGLYRITASIDDVLVINKAGYYTKEVLIETEVIPKVVLTSKNQELDEVIVAGDKRVDNTVETAYGEIDEDRVGTSTKTLTKESFSKGATTLRQLIIGKVAGVEVKSNGYSGSQVYYKIRGGNQSITNPIPPVWIVNGTPYQDPPEFLDVQQIESISVLKSVSATSRYGTLAAGGAFLIKTSDASFKDKAKKAQRSALVSGNEYVADSKAAVDASLPAYIVRFRERGSLDKQFKLYQKLSRTQESPLEFYVDAANYFSGLDETLGDEVRADLAYISRNNSKALRTLAYVYDTRGDTKNMVLVNERIAKIAPQEAQSYRDLALAYQQDGQYNKALELYINMLGEQIRGVNFDGLEKPLRSELSHLVALHKDKIDYERLPNEWLRADFDIDIRMVVEWSDRSVPFEFQFVNPEKKFFKWTHTLEDNRERLQAEQRQGFQTEEFIIDDAPPGEWLINIQYLGDESDYVLPPFLKYTVFKNYGTPEETREIKVVKLFKQLDKVTLGKVSL